MPSLKLPYSILLHFLNIKRYDKKEKKNLIHGISGQWNWSVGAIITPCEEDFFILDSQYKKLTAFEILHGRSIFDVLVTQYPFKIVYSQMLSMVLC